MENSGCSPATHHFSSLKNGSLCDCGAKVLWYCDGGNDLIAQDATSPEMRRRREVLKRVKEA